MKLKSLLFGSAAIIAAGTGAQAADLPIAEPVEYVRICDAFGAGYFYIPGSDTCLRIGGYVHAEAHYVDFPDDDDDEDGDDDHREFNNFTTRARAEIHVETKTQTDIGVIGTLIQYRMDVGPSNEGDYSGTSPTLNEGVITLANDWGLFAFGHTASQFDFWGSTIWGSRIGIDDNTGDQTQFSYTATFGGGFSAVISIEDPASGDRRLERTLPDAPLFNYEGQEWPDLVLALGVEQGWGEARLSGVLHHIHDKDEIEALEGEDDDDMLGWAVLAGVQTEIAGFSAAIEAGYADGALGYITTDPGGVGDFDDDDDDLDLGDDESDTNSAWMVRGGLGANFTETVAANINASYTSVNDNNGDDDDDGDGDEDDFDYDFIGVGANVIWTPAPGFSMGPEVAYNRIDFDDDEDDGDEDDDDDSDDVWGVMFRVERSF